MHPALFHHMDGRTRHIGRTDKHNEFTGTWAGIGKPIGWHCRGLACQTLVIIIVRPSLSSVRQNPLVVPTIAL
jgi:hypothetical protein